jgi:hypothetical protein
MIQSPSLSSSPLLLLEGDCELLRRYTLSIDRRRRE